ncbi:MAG: hypothetical protein A2W71_03010 [Candidatus Nealsonbacteria bacterium RIFCSPLOWO2_02_39_8]|uniref:Transketolase N-terminal domain-containing protein n=1 Tax=Candidatus Nealsonbacteria bacterium RIFCSPLOWO2_02_39_8 TaxID=1801674 RepID=A0A1G2EIN5_9BACT|nr:MAG: hypothetical protein A2W71_03010 [Candidatus Nealsonbacteria bacterium RIFCSPLOWO2_02_39_8]
MTVDTEILKKKANLTRREVLETVARTGKGHLGGTFSCVDILTALYYGGILKFDPKNPKWQDRDRLVIGKGHACLALYNILVDLGFFDRSRLEEYGSNGSSLGGQLNIDTPGVEYNTGSLGHALGIGAGMALAAKMDNKNYRVFALIGDGECGEGSIWESIMFSSQQKLNNLIGIIDRNRLSVTDVIEDDGSGKLEDKLRACGWKCITIDGHSFEEIINVMDNFDNLEQPLMIIANTVKGKGVSFMENGIKWHHSVPTAEELDIARKELNF